MNTKNKIISLKTNEYRFQVFLGTNIIGVTTIKYDKNFIEFSLIETDRKHQKKGIGSGRVTPTKMKPCRCYIQTFA